MSKERAEYVGQSRVDGWLFGWNYRPQHPDLGNQPQWPELRVTAGERIRVRFLDGHGQTPVDGFELVAVIRGDDGKRYATVFMPSETEVPLAG